MRFANKVLGIRWVTNFIWHNREPTLKRRASSENAAQVHDTWTHRETFRPSRSTHGQHDIGDPTRIFNLDEAWFSIRGITLGRSKCVVNRGKGGNKVEANLRGTYDNLTLIPLVSAAGRIMTPTLVLLCKDAKHRKRSTGKFDTPSYFLPSPHFLYMRHIGGVNSNIFYSWAGKFVKSRTWK